MPGEELSWAGRRTFSRAAPSLGAGRGKGFLLEVPLRRPQIPCLSPSPPSALTWLVLPRTRPSLCSVRSRGSTTALCHPLAGTPAEACPRGQDLRGRGGSDACAVSRMEPPTDSLWGARPPPAVWGQRQGPGHFLQLNRFFCDISLIMCKYFPNWAHFKLYLKCAGGERGFCAHQAARTRRARPVPVLPFPGREETPFPRTLIKAVARRVWLNQRT